MIPVQTLTAVLEQMPGVRLAVLFGSAARGTMRPGSDLDVAVSLDGTADALPAMNVALEQATGRRVDLLSLDHAPPLLRFEIARRGILLMQRRADDWVEFRAHAMIDWWDWAPTARSMHKAMATRPERGSGAWFGVTSSWRKSVVRGHG